MTHRTRWTRSTCSHVDRRAPAALRAAGGVFLGLLAAHHASANHASANHAAANHAAAPAAAGGFSTIPGPEPAAVARPQGPGEALRRLRSLEGDGGWNATVDQATGRLRMLRGGVSRPLPGEPADAAATFLSRHGELVGLDRPGTHLEPMGEGRATRLGTRVRFEQTHQGLPVAGAGVTVIVDDANRVTHVVGSAEPIGAIDLQPGLTAGAARRRAAELIAGGDEAATTAPTLAVHPAAGGRLVWLAGPTMTRGGETIELPWTVALDARTGAVVERRRNHAAGGPPPIDPCDRAWIIAAPPGEAGVMEVDEPADPFKVRIEVGTGSFGSSEDDPQAEAPYAAGIALLPGIEYTISVSWHVHTWDAYGAFGRFGDVFFVHANSEGFLWDLAGPDPFADHICSHGMDFDGAGPLAGPLWTAGGFDAGDGGLCGLSGFFDFDYHEPDTSKVVFLSIGLLTGIDGAYPSWGTFDVLIEAETPAFDPNPMPFASPGDLDDGNEAVPADRYARATLPGLDVPDPGEHWTLAGPACLIADLGIPSDLDLTSRPFDPPVSRDGVFPFLRDCDGFEAVNCFQHVSDSRGHLLGIGHGGVMDYRLEVDPHAFLERNAFFYHTGGGAGILLFGDGAFDAAEDGDVIVHEYGHAIQAHQTGGAYLFVADPFGFGNEAGAMGEGFSDYWAVSHFEASDVARGATPGIVGEWFEPGGLRDLSNGNTYPGSMVGAVHEDGLIWGGLLWSLHQSLGRAVVEDVVLSSHALVPFPPDFGDGAEALIAADAAISGGANAAAIEAEAWSRGILRRVSTSSIVIDADGVVTPGAADLACDVPDVLLADDVTTPHVYSHQYGDEIVLTAEPVHGGQSFRWWTVNGTVAPVGAAPLRLDNRLDTTVVAVYAPGEDVACGPDELSQSASLDIHPFAGVACDEDGVTSANAFARSYDLAADPDLAGRDVLVRCVDLAIEGNTGSGIGGAVTLYRDTDGGDPIGPDDDLEVTATSGLFVPAATEHALLKVVFDPPVEIPADTVLVVEMAIDAHVDGGVWPGCNDDGESGETWIRAADCGVPTYDTMEEIGHPDTHWAQALGIEVLGDDPITGDLDGDGDVDVADLLELLSAWGACPAGPCPADLDGDGVVGVLDLLTMLEAWG